MPTRSPYTGACRKLVLAFDVGTTYSGISYSILDPGQVPEIKGITRFPAQERSGGDSKIPTIIYYDQEGKVRAVGAEAVSEGVEQIAEEEGWTKAEWFKLHMRTQALASSTSADSHLLLLPNGKSVVDLFGDFLRYLFSCAKNYIRETYPSAGDELWASIEQEIEYVLTHPNGWEGAQQEQMRKAAIIAGLVPDTDIGHSRIRFVTEGEASLHFCIQSDFATQALKNGDGVVIVDAGGGTVDLSAYSQVSPSTETSFIEIAPPECHFQGSIFVTRRARAFINNLLCNTKFGDDVDNVTKSFDKTTKLTFRNINDPQFIKFGSVRDKDPTLNIRSGQLKLLGEDVATFFDPSVACIVKAVLQQCKSATIPVSSVFLVGGFAASDWLYNQLKNSLEPFGLHFSRPDSHVNKAVADGAVSFYLDHFVSARISKMAYGINCSVPFDPTNKEHQNRLSSVFTSLTGEKKLSGVFSVILQKGVQVSETTEFRRSYFRPANSRSQLTSLSTSLKCYQGASENPKWLDVDANMFSTLCYIEADTSQISQTLKPHRSPGASKKKKKSYYIMEFDVVLLFGLTELKAQIAWKEGGEEKRSPARIVYDRDR